MCNYHTTHTHSHTNPTHPNRLPQTQTPTPYANQVLLLIGLSVGGSLVMRKYRTSLAVGFFLGVVVIMSQTMLVLFAVFAGRASTTDDEDEKPADRAFAAFCFFLWIVYSAFAGECGLEWSESYVRTYSRVRPNSPDPLWITFGVSSVLLMVCID